MVSDAFKPLLLLLWGVWTSQEGMHRRPKHHPLHHVRGLGTFSVGLPNYT